MATTREELAGRVRALALEASVAGLDAEAALLARAAGALQGGIVLLDDALAVQRCQVCGCTEDRPCPGGCGWIEPDLCSACIPPGHW